MIFRIDVRVEDGQGSEARFIETASSNPALGYPNLSDAMAFITVAAQEFERVQEALRDTAKKK